MKKQKSKFIFEGNDRCLDFINTEIMDKGRPLDLIENFSDFVDWLAQAQMLSTAEAKKVIIKWNGKPEAEETLRRAKSLRLALRNMVQRIVNRKPVELSSIDEINKTLRTSIGHSQLVKVDGGFEMRFRTESDQPACLITPIAQSTCELLCNSDLSLIKRCENPACVLYFYDTSKNHARRWCSMKVCGNRMKAAAHYKRYRRKKRL